MPAKEDPPHPQLVGHGTFHTTHWSVVLAARDGKASQAQEALNSLCCTYWRPIYTYVRRAGFSPVDAQDITQAFFAQFLEKEYLQRLKHNQGRFRSFLLLFVKRFVSDERDKARAEKRGGGQHFISWDDCAVEEQRLPALDRLDAARAFDRRWATTLLERAQARLREEFVANGKAALFEFLQPFQSAEEPKPTYAEVAAQLAIPENTLKSLVHRLRLRYRQLLREEVAQTVSEPGLVDEEIHYLLSVLGD
jgi:DNA-directed RNA polymerase specialized sigma24 family protein